MRNMLRVFWLVVAGFAMTGCATTYGGMGISGGFEDRELDPGVWRVTFSGNGFTTQETVQVYWLYHCAELAQTKGFDGFEITSQVNFVDLGRKGLVKLASTGSDPMFIPPVAKDKPGISAEIRLLKRPFTPVPGKVFDADALITALDPYVNGRKCYLGNVCPHIHHYVLPEPVAAQ